MRRSRRLGVGGRRGVLVWGAVAASAAALCVGAAGAAGSAGGASVGVAPVWPFRGVVNGGGDVLEYWDAETGALSEVRLGNQPGCPSPVVGNEDYVELESWSGGGGRDVILRVPWGDEAYPYFALSEDVPRRFFKQSRDVGVDVSTVLGGFRVVTAAGEAYYRISDDWEPRLVRTGGSLEEHAAAVGDGIDPGWEPFFYFDGTDGYHYGFRAVHPEPNCQQEEGFIVAGDTGEVVVCGWMRGGALLVLPQGAPRVVERFALPQPGGCTRSAQSWGFQLGGLSLPADSGG